MIIHFKNIKIELIDIESNKGSISIENTDGLNHFFSWSAMRGDIVSFIKSIDHDYFARKLSNRIYCFDRKNTFKNLRAILKNDLDLNHYNEMAFQKSFRSAVTDFEKKMIGNESETANFFYDNFYLVKFYTDFSLISDIYRRNEIEDYFDNIEPQYLIAEKFSDEYYYLSNIFLKLKKYLINIENKNYVYE